MSNDQPPASPAWDDDPTRPPPRPVAPPGQVSTPDQLPTVEPGEWPAQPVRRVAPPPPPPPPPAPPPPPSPVLPAPAAPPPRGGLLGLWLGLAAMVVLVLGAGTTLVVVRPWSDDPTGSAGSEVSVALPTGPADEEQEGDAAPVPTEQAEPSTPPPPSPTPAPTAPVTGDLDGDGLGDATAVFGRGDAITRLLLTSTGEGFAVEREPASSYDDRTWADFDGDGRLDQVSWGYRTDGTLALTSGDLGLRELDFRLRLDRAQPFVTLKAGDFDGDGAPDLVAYGATSSTEVGVWVLRNVAGGFAAPEQWMRVPHTTYALTTLLPADFTGDGIADVVARVPVALPRGRADARLGLALMASSGSGFVATPLERPTPFADDADVVVGDLTGDGTPRVLLLGAGRHGLEAQVLRVKGARVVRDRRWDAQPGGPGVVADAVVSDVDGDGTDEVVYTTALRQGYDGFRVLDLREVPRSRDAAWAATPRCSAGDCVLYFQNGY